MPIELYLAFVAATALLILTPGPMVAFVIATTLERGFRFGLAAVAGSTLASAVQLGVVAFGLYSVLEFAGQAFMYIKWAGVLYLVYLGVRSLRAPADDLGAGKAAEHSFRRTFVDGLVVNLTNPKALLFHAAFLPLFIAPSAPIGGQLAVLSVTFIVIAASLDILWAVSAERARPLIAKAGRWRHRFTGAILLTAAAGLAFVKK